MQSMFEPIRHEAQKRRQQERNGSGRPGLRVTRYRIAHRRRELTSREAGKEFRQAVVFEMAGGLYQTVEDLRGFAVKAVATQAGRDDGVIVRPDSSQVIANRIGPTFLCGKRPNTPAAIHVRGSQMTNDRGAPCRIDDASPKRLSWIRTDHRRRAVPTLESDGVKILVGDPKLSIEPCREIIGLLPKLRCHRKFARPRI